MSKSQDEKRESIRVAITLNNLFLRYTEENFYIKPLDNDNSLFLGRKIRASEISNLITKQERDILNILLFNNLLPKKSLKLLMRYYYQEKLWGPLLFLIRDIKSIKIAAELGILMEFLDRYLNYLGLYLLVEEFNQNFENTLTDFNSFISFIFSRPNEALHNFIVLEGLLSREHIVVLLRAAFHAVVANEVNIKGNNLSYFFEHYSEELEDYQTYFQQNRSLKHLYPIHTLKQPTHQCNEVAVSNLASALNLNLSPKKSYITSDPFYNISISYSKLPLSIKSDHHLIKELLAHYPDMVSEILKDTPLIKSLSKDQLKVLFNETTIGYAMQIKILTDNSIVYDNKFDLLVALAEADKLPDNLNQQLLIDFINFELDEGILFPSYPKVLNRFSYSYLSFLEQSLIDDSRNIILADLFKGMLIDNNFPTYLRERYFYKFLESANTSSYPLSKASRKFKIYFNRYLQNQSVDLSEYLMLSKEMNLSHLEVVKAIKAL